MIKNRFPKHRLSTLVMVSAIITILITFSAVENVSAQSREKTLRVVTQDIINRLDVGKGGHERACYGPISGIYDRLVTWERDHLGNGFYHYAPTRQKGDSRWPFRASAPARF